MKISILDYGCGNVYNVVRALNYIGVDEVKIVKSSSEILQSEKIILPGVGSFPHAMKMMEKNDVISPLIKHVKSGKILIGICLGMQLLFESSEEIRDTCGLGFVPGKVLSLGRMIQTKKMKIPHVGWSNTFFHKSNVHDKEHELKKEQWFYYNHSYFAKPGKVNDCIAITKFGNNDFCAAVKRDNVIGFQFHPERSAETGISLLSKYINI